MNRDVATKQYRGTDFGYRSFLIYINELRLQVMFFRHPVLSSCSMAYHVTIRDVLWQNIPLSRMLHICWGLVLLLETEDASSNAG